MNIVTIVWVSEFFIEIVRCFIEIEIKYYISAKKFQFSHSWIWSLCNQNKFFESNSPKVCLLFFIWNAFSPNQKMLKTQTYTFVSKNSCVNTTITRLYLCIESLLRFSPLSTPAQAFTPVRTCTAAAAYLFFFLPFFSSRRKETRSFVSFGSFFSVLSLLSRRSEGEISLTRRNFEWMKHFVRLKWDREINEGREGGRKTSTDIKDTGCVV